MDTVAIDVGTAYVDLAKWDGHELQIEKLPTVDPLRELDHWFDLLAPRKGFAFSFRGTGPRLNLATIDKTARHWGAGKSCHIPGQNLAATIDGAKWSADRHRLSGALMVECGAHWATGAVLDSRSEPREALPEGRWRGKWSKPRISVKQITTWLVTNRAAATDHLVSCGGIGPILAANLAEHAGLPCVLIPDHAGCMGAVGMAITPEVFEEESFWSPCPPDATFLRSQFSDLLNRLSNQLASAGCDFDDVVIHRYVEMGDEETGFWEQPCGSIVDELDYANPGQWSPHRGIKPKVRGAALKMQAAIVRAVVDARQWELPPPAMVKSVATKALDDRSVRELAPDGEIIERDSLSIGSSVEGAVIIRDRFHVTVVSDGWRAEVSRAGGILLRRIFQAS